MAEGVLRQCIVDQGLDGLIDQVDSCGTGAYHEGSQPDSRTLATLRRHGTDLTHKARQITEDDFKHFNYILAMDSSNLADIKAMTPAGSAATVTLFGQYGSGQFNKIIKDPYYGSNNSGFDTAYDQCIDFSAGLIDHVKASRAAE